jgi:hypothetical protein
MGLVHAPFHAEVSDELKFLQKPPGQQKVICPDSGPVITKDIADCLCILVDRLLGEQMRAYIATDLARQRPHMGNPGGHDAMDRFSPDAANPFADRLGAGGAGLSRGMRPGTASRMPRSAQGRLGAGARGLPRHRS